MGQIAVEYETQPNRASKVVHDLMGGHRTNLPLFVSKFAPQKHGDYHQACLAHLTGDIVLLLN